MSEADGERVNCDLCGADACERVIAKAGTFYCRCRQCGFVYANPRPRSATADSERYFAYQRGHYIEATYSARRQRAYRRTLSRLRRHRRTGRLLELGCSVGGFLYRAREMGWAPVGVEIVPSCAEYARQAWGLEVVCRPLERADLPADAFDVVYSNALLEHLPRPGRAMREVARVLRPGGVVYTKTINLGSYTHELLGDDWSLLRPDVHPSLFTPETLKRCCTQAGLEVVGIRSSGVRIPNGRGNGLTRALRKTALSWLSRVTLKGDRLALLARKPGR